MLLPPFEMVEPATLDRLFMAIREGGSRVRIVAGGTDLIPDLKREHDRRFRFPSFPALRPGPFPEKLISIARIKSLKGLLFPRKGAARIGVMTTMADLLDSARVRKDYGALADGAATMGTPQVRNRATLGGNLCNARPCADTAPAVIALSAKLEIESSARDRRMVKASDFFTGPGQTVLKPHEVLVAIHLPVRKKGNGSAYFKLGTRKACEIALVSSAAWVSLAGDIIQEARIVLGSVAPTPFPAVNAGAFLEGKGVSESTLLGAAREAAAEAKPIDDFRASAAYRRSMIRVLTLRALSAALERAR